MNSHLSPKDLALAIGVSESSLKRWVDEGRLVATRTVGGHRRIEFCEALRFIRESGAEILRPDLLGVPELTESVIREVAQGRGDAALLAGLRAGDSERACGVMVAQFLSFRSIAAVCDGPLAFALHRIAEMRLDGGGAAGALEARAEKICTDGVERLRELLPPPVEAAPVAVLADAESEHGKFANTLAAACFGELGVREFTIGAGSPAEAIVAEAKTRRAKFVWLGGAVARGQASSELVDRVKIVSAGVGDVGVLIGGRTIAGVMVPPLHNLHVVWSMSELASLVRATLSHRNETVAMSERAASNGHLNSRPERPARATR